MHVRVGVAERQDRPLTDVLMNADRFAGFVVNEVDFGLPYEDRLPILDLELSDDAGTHDLRRRNAIRFHRDRSHEGNAATRHDVSVESIGA